jgi:hypothetical protein
MPHERQRAELTFKHNRSLGRHGWLRLTPAYSVKVVEGVLADKPSRLTVIDPFSGTGTTPLCAVMHGHRAAAVDVNPFLVWLGNAKLATYDRRTVRLAWDAGHEAVRLALEPRAPAVEPPNISHIERWWSVQDLGFLCRLMKAIHTAVPRSGRVRTLLSLAFCRTMIGLSNAAFNHQSMSFKNAAPSPQMALFDGSRAEVWESQALADLTAILAGASDNPLAAGRVIEGDSRDLPGLFDGGADVLITSPPYPNRMSYVRELRPYMYWLGYLQQSHEAGDLDWKAIGGTWGAATSRVAAWSKTGDSYFPDYLPALLERIRLNGSKSGDTLARYVGKYFEDIWYHLSSAVRHVKRGGELHYIVGNSKFYDVIVPTEVIYQDMLRKLGVKSVAVLPLRKRNSKKELIEYDVVATR